MTERRPSIDALYWVNKRRKALADSVSADERSTRVPSPEVLPAEALGLALSGGGIRSATLSLGLVQAFSRHDRLFDFDYCSTVSGGGYFGSFLTSLFVSGDRRGRLAGGGAPAGMVTRWLAKVRSLLRMRPAPPASDRAARNAGLSPKAMRAFAERVLDTDANVETMPDPEQPTRGSAAIQNPIWWLREHGRYLAPNGATDYMYAVALISRNWLALIYTFMIAALGAFLLIFWITLAASGIVPVSVVEMLHRSGPVHSADLLALIVNGQKVLALSRPIVGPDYQLSPLLIIPLATIALASVCGVAFWTTSSLDIVTSWSKVGSRLPARPRLYLQALGIFIAATFVTAVVLGFVAKSGTALDSSPWAWIVLAAVMALAASGALCAIAIASRVGPEFRDEAFTNELRRKMTVVSAHLLDFFLWSLALALIDTIALNIQIFTGAAGGPAALVPLVAPAGAWLLTKIPQWLGGGRLAKFLGEHVWTVALIAGALAFAFLAILADLAIHALAWVQPSPTDPVVVNYPVLIAYTLTVAVLFGVTGLSKGFVNLSALNNFYAGRLTRAYIGAANLGRLRKAAKGDLKITENDPGDYIDIMRYRDANSIAPIHLINATLNETRSRTRSQLVDRDRKGVPIVFAPEGILVNMGCGGGDEAHVTWEDAKKENVDALSLGQLCAISGAAASSGMGSRTTLGGALAFTFANVRLGYWWVVKNAIVAAGPSKPTRKADAATGESASAKRTAIRSFWSRGPLYTFHYLFCEATARYASDGPAVYLSDGGHFENSGAYELLRRGVKTIVVGDFAEDQQFEFEDLENLVRKARIDLGMSVVVSSPTAVRDLFGSDGASIFLNRHENDWRGKAQAPDSGFALLLDVYQRPEGKLWREVGEHLNLVSRIVWIKPKLIVGLPEDIRGYAARNAAFPQQSTANQFFDEAQWECYRALGYALGTKLLMETSAKNDALRKICKRMAPVSANGGTPAIVVRK